MCEVEGLRMGGVGVGIESREGRDHGREAE